MLKRLLFSLLSLAVFTTAIYAQCPTLLGPGISTNQACIGDVVTLTMASGSNLVPGSQTVDWYAGATPGFDPLTQGTYVGSAAIVGSSGPCTDPPIVLGGLVNPCNGSNPSNGSEENEAMFIWSAGGFNAADLGVEVNNLGGPTTENIGTLGPCPLLTTPTVSVAGGCVVYGGPATVVPANAFVLVFTSSEADINFDFSGLCALGFPIYIFQNSCTRLMGTTVPGAFSNSGPHSYMAEFGCPGPNQSLTYSGSTGNNTFTAGWTLLGVNFPAPCNGTPFIPAPPTVPVASVTIDPLNVTITANECGQQYYSAVVAPPVPGCPPQAGVGDLSLFVECPELMISGVETVCVGSPSSGIQVSFTGTNPPYTFEYSVNSVSQGQVTTSDNPYTIPFTPSSAGTFTFDLVSVAGTTCPASFSGSGSVTATAGGTTAPLSTTICANAQPVDLTTLEDPAYPGGTWSGANVSGTSFNAGPGASGPYTVTYSPPAGSNCTTPGTATITIDAAVPIGLVTPPILCGPTTYDLNLLFGGSPIAGSWSGPNLTLPSTFNAPPIGGTGATFAFTFTPSTGCYIPPVVNITVSAGTPAMPLNASVCVSSQPVDLTTLEDPAFPGGTWSGSNVIGSSFDAGPSASGNYPITYTPPASGGGCSSPGTSTITITPETNTTLATATACVSNAPIDLSTLVVGGFPTGTWTGSGVSGGFFDPSTVPIGTYTLNFTPTPGLCYRAETTTITVVPAINANLSTATLCITDPSFALVGIEDPAWPGGTWSGTGVSGGLFNPSTAGIGTTTITYSPPAGQCAIATTTTITVTNQTSPTLGTATVCETDPLFDLTTLQDPAFPVGTWSGTGVSGTNFNPSSAGIGPASLTFTPSGGSACEGPSTTTITVTPANTPTLGTAMLCETDPSFDLSTIVDPSYPSGTWSGPGVSGSNFSPPIAGSGPISVTFTPVAGSCAATVNTTITVAAAGPAQPLDATICASDQPLDLTTLDDPAAPGGTWSGANVSGSTFDAGPGASGSYSVTYTPPAGACVALGTATITISANGTPTLGVATVCLNGGLYDLFNIQDPAFSTGDWSGFGVTGSFFDPNVVGVGSHSITFTPSGGCLSPASTTITVINSVTPVLATAALCASDTPLDLSTLEDPAYTGGVWSGTNVSAGFFDPAIGPGNYSLTFTSSEICVAPSTATVTVTQSGTPVLGQATVCETETIDLTTLQDPAYPLGTWSGANVLGTTFTAVGLSASSYTLTFAPSASCAQTSTTTVNVVATSTTSGRDTVVCAGSSSFALDMMLNGPPISGTWSGTGVAAGQFDAANSTSGTYALTFTPSQSACASSTIIQITVEVSGAPVIMDQTVCASSPTVDLNTLVPIQYAGGVWSGTNVSGNSFDPSTAGPGSYTLLYTPSGTCTSPVTVSITVSNSITLSLPPLEYCIDAGTINLSALDPAAAPGGSWSGPGISGNQLDPSIAGTGNYTVTYTPPPGGCTTSSVNTPLQISPLTTVGILIDTVCAGSGPIDLNAQLDPSFASGSWSGSSVTSTGIYSPTTFGGPDPVTFTPQGGCYTSTQFTFDVVGVSTLSAGQPTFTCSPDGQTYSATISVTSTPNNGTISTSIGTFVGSLLTVTGLISGTSNFVAIDDAATCNAATSIDLSYTCPSINCTTDAGTLTGGPYQLCSSEQLTNAGVNGFTNDGNDVLFYFLDDDTNPDNGVLAQNSDILFNAPVGGIGQLLFVYALAGDDDGFGGVSAIDNCRSQSNSIQVTWAAPMSISIGTPVCNTAQNSFTVDISISGGWAPYTQVSGFAGSFSSPSVFRAGPLASGSSANFSFADTQNCGPATEVVTYDCSSPCVAPFPGTFDLNPLLLCDNYITDASFNNDATLGTNDLQVFVVYSDAAGTIEIGRFPTLPIDLGVLGISSGTVYVSSLAGENDGSGGISATCFDESPLRAVQLGQTQFVPFDTTVCSGTVVMIAGNTYTQTNNTGFHRISGFGGSCDTVVNVTVNFSLAGGTTIDRTDVICNNESLIIGGQTFNASNPSDTFTVGATACDTTYRVALTVLPPADSLLRDTLCFGDSLVIGNLVFNQFMQTGTSVLRASSGCDSIVTVELEFLREPEVSLLGPPSYCGGEDIEVTIRVGGTRSIMGDVFVNGNPTGSTTLPVGDNTLSFPASSGFSFRLSNIIATTGGCAEASPQQVSYSPQVSQLNAEIPLPLSGDYTACGDNTVASISVQTGNGVGPYSYAWSTGDTTNTITNVGQGVYAVTITDDLGCSSMTDVTVTEGDTLTYTLSTIDPECPNGDGSISISLDELPPNAQFRFDLPGLDPVTSPDFSFDSLASGTYVFQLIQENGCDQSTLITIDDPEFYDIIRFDTIDIDLGDSARIFLDLPNTLDSIRWLPGEYIDCDTCERVLVSPPFNLEYEAIAYTTEGCEVGDRVFIRVNPLADIYIPTAFSPNGDRINDVLLPYGGPEVERIESFKVFDRWGNLLHNTVGFSPGDELYGWDGRHRGRLMNSAVFVALAEVRFKNGSIQSFSTDVLLVR